MSSACWETVKAHLKSPEQGYWLTLDADGLDLPSDWYLRLAREITRMFHGETQPSEKMPLMN